MSRTQPLHGALTSLESARAALLDGLAPVAPQSMPLAEARGCIAAEMPGLHAPLPQRNKAVIDGWALPSLDLAGASPYSPVPLSRPPQWIETGQALPEGCDCILEPDLVEHHGPMAQAVAEAIPGQGVRRTGEDIAAGRPAAIAGRGLSAADLLALRATGADTVMVRAPRLSLIDVAHPDGTGPTAEFIAALAQADGAAVTATPAAREAQSIAAAISEASADLFVLIGGTGAGRTDCSADAIKDAGTLIAHGLALQPGETAAIGRRGIVPIVALPGLPDHALGAYLMLVQPLIDRLAARLPRQGTALPLSRKIASTVGVAEVALVRREAEQWQVLGTGNLSLDHIRMADAWLTIGADSEGHAAGTPVEAFPLRAT
ncbi:molybdopterin-binding protein [Manganibacter manganicus]|uniref:Molybdopterin molybdenumtransferase n=1 Tax=Manganibacter manganicus TaxID=1873176 RepID=A0A1V8RPG1_9HYPH|nr:molybdopterin-binding protein [Pseudaminobacter manganicus]OQM75091.1 molybdopterin-binding protein [Pseudaminobacter manganicus]